MAELDRLQNHRLFDLRSADFDHVHAFAVAREDQFHVRIFHLRRGGVDRELLFDTPDADRGDRTVKRQAADSQGGGGGGAGQNIRLILAVGRFHPALNHDLVVEAFGKQRTDRPVDHPHGQDFLGRRRAFPLAKSAGKFAGGAEPLAVIDLQGEKVDAFPRGAAHDRRQNAGFAVGGEDGRVGLLGPFAGFKAQGAPTDFLFNHNMFRHFWTPSS